ncbi:hypothetical protein DYB25_003973 [Aphanomyces astaci]|uniref:FCH domain-containing protein n=1 Tax=Aphanomyces astaci TaxID=112090 RepID=A0A397ATW5_APHAT|nr:hypothetical protein DYB25_003973 [Aphanomyces astaci]
MEVARTTIPGLSFPTDLLFNLDAVRKHCTADLATHNACLSMLKGRMQLEHYYATELARLADQFKIDDEDDSNDPVGAELGAIDGKRGADDDDGDGGNDRTSRSSTLKEALRGLRAQYTNTSVQHKALAANLDEDVYQPMHTLYKYLVKKESKLTVCTTRVRKQTKAFEEHYRKQHIKFDKHFKDASTTYAQAMDVGIAREIIHNQYLASPVHLRPHEKHHPDKRTTPPPTHSLDPAATSDAVSSPQHSPELITTIGTPAKPPPPSSPHITVSDGTGNTPRPRSTSMSRSTLDGTKLVSWLLPSGQQKKDNLLITSVKAIETAETSRHECRVAWNGFEDARVALFRSIQSILNDYQRDIRAFIVANQRMVVPSMTVNDLCRADNLPLPPSSAPLVLADITTRKCPVDVTGNTHTVYGWLTTRSQSCQAKGNLPLVVSTVTAKALLAALEVDQPTRSDDKQPESTGERGDVYEATKALVDMGGAQSNDDNGCCEDQC